MCLPGEVVPAGTTLEVSPGPGPRPRPDLDPDRKTQMFDVRLYF